MAPVSSITRALPAALALLISCSITAALAAHAPAVAPISVQESQNAISSHYQNTNQKLQSYKPKFARIAAAAICTEDLATISFQEYSVDWSDWLKQMSARWSQAMNGTCSRNGLKPSGPMFVEFTCNRDGSISEVVIDRSSGDRMCDALQIGTLLHCVPMPAFPAQSRKHNITLLCIWSYASHSQIAKTARGPKEHRTPIKLSISGASL